MQGDSGRKCPKCESKDTTQGDNRHEPLVCNSCGYSGEELVEKLANIASRGDVLHVQFRAGGGSFCVYENDLTENGVGRVVCYNEIDEEASAVYIDHLGPYILYSGTHSVITAMRVDKVAAGDAPVDYDNVTVEDIPKYD